jgi:hypothetical protein
VTSVIPSVSSVAGLAVQLSSAPAVWAVMAGVFGVTSNNVQNSLLGFGPSGQTREGSNPLRGVGPSLFGPWEDLGGELRPDSGPLDVSIWTNGAQRAESIAESGELRA